MLETIKFSSNEATPRERCPNPDPKPYLCLILKT